MIERILTKEKILKHKGNIEWREAAHLCANILEEEGSIGPDYIKSIISTIEQYGPYIILVPGIAFFHGAPSSGVNQLDMSLVLFENEVRFTDFENQPIKAAFAFAAIDSESHLQMLTEFAMLLGNEEFTTLLRNYGKVETILEIIQKGELVK